MICHSDQCFSTSGKQNFDGAGLRSHQDEMHLFSSYQEEAYLRGGQKISAECFMESRTGISGDRLGLKSQNKISNVLP